MSETQRKNIKICHCVSVVQKQHQRSGELTQGIVKNLLTHSPRYYYGIKVRLESGIVGRVKQID